MDFSLSAEQEAIRDAVEKICARFGDDYWLAKDRDGGFPHDFHRAFADAGWLGVACRRNTAARASASPKPR